MAKISEIIEKIEKFAPLSLAAEWDNSGWQVFFGNNREVKKILLALSPSIDVVRQAIKEKYDLIVTHHPLIFGKINNIDSTEASTLPLIEAIQHNIPVYAAHTNLDSAKGGVADVHAKLLGLKNVKPFENFVRIGELDSEQDLDAYLKTLKKTLKVKHLTIVNPSGKTKIKTIALCPGSGGDFISKLNNHIDLYITADIRYHKALDVQNMAVVDAGHFETERQILPVLKKLLKDMGVEIVVAKEKSPFEIF